MRRLLFVCLYCMVSYVLERIKNVCAPKHVHILYVLYITYIYIFACIFTIICVLPLCIPIYCTYSILYRYIHLHMYIQLLISICTYIQYIYTHSLLQTFLLHSYFLDIYINIQYITCCISTVNMYLH